MTLRRKNLVGHVPFVLGYFGALCLGYFVATADALAHGRWALVNAVGNMAALARLHPTLQFDKYALWVGMALLVHVLRDSEAAAPVWAPLWVSSTVALAALGVKRCRSSST